MHCCNAFSFEQTIWVISSLRRFLLYTRNDSLSGLLDSMMGHFLTGAFAWIETSETPDEARPGWWRVVQEIMRLDVSCMDRHMKKFFHALSVEEKLIGAKQNSLIRYIGGFLIVLDCIVFSEAKA